ncbi:hypothetical protein LEP1GSC047_2945 [Leptospira inadai serovar Lyme str. 10]|uniref:Uncharacterized protein n=1 Tax=Leptospira inadai serovar Lyme str. 10 TaxID=1049790 RepID=V6HB62_9LEPT|nr:hypothetical protein LEP1GSC047_2945 [Leptospira inadai serovar Lyme str. 10]
MSSSLSFLFKESIFDRSRIPTNPTAIQNIGPAPPRSQIMEREFFP